MSQVVQQAEEHVQRQKARAWLGTFAEYWELAVRTPAVTRTAAGRAHQAVLSAGVARLPDGRMRYPFFADELFGIDATIEQVVVHLESAARGFETRRRVLLLVGPPGSGKSTLVNRLTQGVEDYTSTEEGAIYAIDGCPLHEDPLHLIPGPLRASVQEQWGITIEGDLCPRCRYVLETEHDGRVSTMPVRRIVLSRTDGVGFGSFVATAPHAVDPQVLVGTTDQSLLTHDRRRNAAVAFRYDGQLFAANRGVMEFVDPFKLDERFLDVLNVVSEERRVPTERFGSVDVDTVLIAHTNEAEYRRFVQAPETAALQDRFVVVRVPHTVEISAEEAIYRKVMAGANFGRVAVAPLAWRIAATWAVLTRLAASCLGFDRVTKARLYDGEGLPGVPFGAADRERRAAPDEGMTGVGPRYVVNRLSVAASTARAPCLTPAQVVTALWDGIFESPRLAAGDQDAWFAHFDLMRGELNRLVQRDVRRASVDDYPERRGQFIDDYLTAAAVWASSGQAALSQESARTLNRLEDRLRLPMAERYQVRAGLGRATDRAACERWLEAAVDAELLPGWPALADRIVRDPAVLERLASRLEGVFGYDPRCIESLLESARDLAHGRTPGVKPAIRWTRTRA